MRVIISDYQLKKIQVQGAHTYIKGNVKLEGRESNVEIFFRDKLEEKKLFEEAEITIEGELVRADGGISIVNSTVLEVKLQMELPLESLNIKDRLNATGLIHEFKAIFRKDKIRAKEILKVLGVPEEYAEEILLRNSYILPE